MVENSGLIPLKGRSLTRWSEENIEGTFSVFESSCHLLLPCSLSTQRERQSR